MKEYRANILNATTGEIEMAKIDDYDGNGIIIRNIDVSPEQYVLIPWWRVTEVIYRDVTN